MPLIQSSIEHLPHIDPPVSEQALAAADALIQTEAKSEEQVELHPSIPAQYEPHFSDLIEAEHARLSAGQPKAEGSGIDLSRYEALDAPGKGELENWRTTLQKAYASAEYLRAREMNLGLLETYGKNAWLIGNSQLEDILRTLEKEVDTMRTEQEAVEGERRAAQENMAAEMKGLEEGWKKGVGRMIETQAAAERLRMEILERKRAAVS
jgi:pre-mRNA-splicing factor SPF27